MKKTVGCFSDEKLEELAGQPNTIVMQPTYTTVFEPWPAHQVKRMIGRLADITRTKKTLSVEEIRDYCHTLRDVEDFAHKYKIMYEKLTTPLFVEDEENVNILYKMVDLKNAVDQNATTDEMARATVSDMTLKSLMSRTSSMRDS